MDERQRYMQRKHMAKKRKRRRRIVFRFISLAFMIGCIIFCFSAFLKLMGQDIGSLNQLALFQSEEPSKAGGDHEANDCKSEDDDASGGSSDLDKQLKRLAQKDSDIETILDNREEYPDELLNLLIKNKETKQFVLDYPKKKDVKADIDISEETQGKGVPLFLQWDEQWGYLKYGEEIMAIDGCGPTCLSMVAVAVLGDTTMNPYWMAKYSEKNGYMSSNATLWTLMTEGAAELGLDVTEIPLDEQRVANNLNVGNPVICIMGPGDFTTSGHFIVLTSYEDGKVTVNDPNSRERSRKKWSFQKISGQIRNLWVYR